MTDRLQPDRTGTRPVGCARWRAPGVLLGGAMLAVLVGCGGSSTFVKKTAEAHFVAVANELCSELKSMRATSPSSPARLATKARLRALESEARKEPRLAAYLSDLATRRRMLAPFSKLKVPVRNRSIQGERTSEPIYDLLEAYRLAVKIRADEKTLGLTSCMGPTPRAPIGG